MTRLATVVTLLAATCASAQYVRTEVEDAGHQLCVTWTRRNFTYHVDSAGSARTPGGAEFTAIESAFATWQAVSNDCSDFTFTRGADVVAPRTGKRTTSENDIIWRERSCDGIVPEGDPCWRDENKNCSSVYSCWPHAFGVLALTTVTHSTRTGAIYDADIELGGVNHLFTTVSSPRCAPGKEAVTCVATDVQNTMTHEIGHVLGFAHVEDPESTMYAYAEDGELTKRVVDRGTIEGFCTTYPRGEPPLPCDPAQQAQRSITARGGGTPKSSQLGCSSVLGGPLALAVLLRCRRRRLG